MMLLQCVVVGGMPDVLQTFIETKFTGESVWIQRGNAKSTKTILKHPEKYHVKNAIKLGDYNIGRNEQILTLPLYLAFLLYEM